MILKATLKFGFAALIFLTIIGTAAELNVQRASAGRTFTSTDRLPGKAVGVVLGTGKTLVNGQLNAFYVKRIDAAVKLYRSGKVTKLVLSGNENSARGNEPQDMRNDLVARGIPEAALILDGRGERTYLSVQRAKALAGTAPIIFVSQRFHNERAIFLAHWIGVPTVGFNADDVRDVWAVIVRLREVGARIRAVIDARIER